MKTGPVVAQWALVQVRCVSCCVVSTSVQRLYWCTSMLSELNCIPSGGVKSMKAGRRVRESQLVVLLEEYVDTSC